MSIVVQPFTDDHTPAVEEFNKRLRARAITYQFPESPIPWWLPRRDPIPLYQEYFVTLEAAVVRGAYILKLQTFAFDGRITMIGHYHLPISEGVVDSRYAIVGLRMLRDALSRQPLLFSVGMGGYNEAVAQLEKNMKWSMVSCPFYFKVNHAFRFLREIVFLRRNRYKRVILDILAFSGLGWIAIHSLQSLRGATQRSATSVRVEEVESFSSWADEIWKRAKDDYAMIAVRDATILNTLYPESNKRFKRLKVLRQGHLIGWVVVLDTQMTEHNHFGAMRVGSVADCLAVPGEEQRVIAIATKYLQGRDVDIIVSNQLHRSWCKAFAANGYLRGPSNFIFAACPQLAEKLHPFEVNASRVHMTRGDGDGPYML
jgi:hypothetical protein